MFLALWCPKVRKVFWEEELYDGGGLCLYAKLLELLEFVCDCETEYAVSLRVRIILSSLLAVLEYRVLLIVGLNILSAPCSWMSLSLTCRSPLRALDSCDAVAARFILAVRSLYLLCTSPELCGGKHLINDCTRSIL